MCGFFIGVGSGYYVLNQPTAVTLGAKIEANSVTAVKTSRNIIGFLPFWLVDDDKNYSPYITTLTYFGLTIDSDGTILKMNDEQEGEPGWHMLNSGGIDDILTQAKRDDLNLSLLIFSADEDMIGEIISDPIPHARNLVEEVGPIMKEYGFTDLNLDIESVKEASPEARKNFTAFVKELKKGIDDENLGTLTIDASPTVLIKDYLINLTEVAPLVDYVVLMTYDYHYPGSYVTGPVAPLGGAGIISEFDSEKGVEEALKIMPKEKIMLGLPLYGYEWETIRDHSRAGVIPGTGITASNKRVEELLEDCSDCMINIETDAQESYVVYEDDDTGTYHQIFYPDKQATKIKLEYAANKKIGGVALWALGYEGEDIMEPLREYKE